MSPSDYSRTFLIIAQQDLKASRCLYENGYYMQAVFYLQQAVEKGAKFFGLNLEFITEKQLKGGKKSVGHKSSEVFKKPLNRFPIQLSHLKKDAGAYQGINKIMKITSCEEPKSLEDVEEGFKGYLNYLNEMSENLRDPFLMFEIIEKLKVETQKYEISKKDIKKISFTNEEIEEWKRNSSKMIQKIRDSNEFRDSPFIEDAKLERMERELENPVPDFMEKDAIIPFLLYILDLYHIFACLPVLSILTENHAMNSRYPDKDLDFDPLDFYLPGHPLIDEFPFLLDMTNELLNKLEDIYYAEKADAWLDKGIILGNLGQHEKALKAVEKALEIDANNAEAWSYKGFILSELKKYKKAKKAAKKSLEIDPENIEAWYNLGIIYDEFGQYDESLAAFTKALNIAIDSNDENSWFIKSMIHSRLENYEEALKALDKVLEINPKNTDALYNKIGVLYDLGREKEAEEVYEIKLKSLMD